MGPFPLRWLLTTGHQLCFGVDGSLGALDNFFHLRIKEDSLVMFGVPVAEMKKIIVLWCGWKSRRA